MPFGALLGNIESLLRAPLKPLGKLVIVGYSRGVREAPKASREVRLSKEECTEFAFLCRNKGALLGELREARGGSGG